MAKTPAAGFSRVQFIQLFARPLRGFALSRRRHPDDPARRLAVQRLQMLAICVFGITVALLPRKSSSKLVEFVALLLAMVGADPHTSTVRFSFGSLYLWDGLPIVPLALGIFAIPELCDMMVRRTSLETDGPIHTTRGQWQGWQDTLSNWFLVLRTAVLGSVCAMVPGLGAAVIDWIAYGHAVKTEKHPETFGSGDVRGVIAAESSTNAREGGSLIPTIAFGIPAHASMAILLSAFLIQGIVPGPEMLTTHLDITYTIVWSIALANVLGTIICFSFANQFARIATIRYTLLLPIVMLLIYMGAFEGQRSWGDIVALLLLGLFAWLMKRCGWPRPPLVLRVHPRLDDERCCLHSTLRLDLAQPTCSSSSSSPSPRSASSSVSWLPCGPAVEPSA